MTVFSKWRIKDVIIATFIAILAGLIFSGFDWIYNLIYVPLAGTGWAPLVGEAMDGLWFMAGPIAFMVTRLPGSALFTEIIGALIESAIGGTFGMAGFLAGFAQGLGSEIAFGSFKYKKINFKILTYAAVLTTITSFIASLFVNSYLNLKFNVLVIYFLVRLASALIFSLILVYLIWQIFQRSKVKKV